MHFTFIHSLSQWLLNQTVANALSKIPNKTYLKSPPLIRIYRAFVKLRFDLETTLMTGSNANTETLNVIIITIRGTKVS